MLDKAVAGIVATFGTETKARLAGVGEPEEALRVPIDHLMTAIGDLIGKKTELDGEAHLSDISSRPDFAVRVKGAVVGYIEVKQAGLSLDPATFKSHNKDQWNRLKDLPNLIYTNGSEWRLYRSEPDPTLVAQLTGGPLDVAGAGLTPDTSFQQLITDFLNWTPDPIRTVSRLVKTIAPITRMLRTKVIEQLEIEHDNVKKGQPEYKQQFLGLASDWRKLLFPDATDAVFADGYAQTVTFALLLARTEDIDLATTSLHEVGQKLGTDHSLMGRALQLLTQDVKGDFLPTIDLLTRVIGEVKWNKVRQGKDTYLHLYENFLAEYDAELRKATGSYYTPHEVVDEMVRLAEEALVTKLGKPKGFLDPSVTTIDPAMGTGTFLHSIIEHVADNVAKSEGPGAVAGTIKELASRLIGFELQLGSFAVSELRTTDLLKSYDADPPKGGMRMFVADTLSDPHAAETQLTSTLFAISESKRKANEIKAKSDITVVIGNPPYKEKAKGEGGWIEDGPLPGAPDSVPLNDFRSAETGASHEKNLRNLYTYFWRWATWKVWESSGATGESGIVCFITPASYLTSQGYSGMRAYMRRQASAGWVIDLTPEGQTPPVPTRIFPGVRQPLAIGLFVRRSDNQLNEPADIKYTALAGLQSDKFEALSALTLSGDQWRPVRTSWNARFTPSAGANWDESPAISDLVPWTSIGVAPKRTWVYGPSRSILGERWARLVVETDAIAKQALFKTEKPALLNAFHTPLPGPDVNRSTQPISKESDAVLSDVVRVGYQSFDRQYLIADRRVIDAPILDLWRGRVDGQLFAIEQHAHPIHLGLPLVFSALIPDMDHFNNRGGRALPLLHPDGTPNLAPGVQEALAASVGREITHEDVLAYIAGVVSHPAFTATFEDELTTPGVRVPITKDPELWQRAVKLGREVVWLHTYGESFVDPDDGREHANVRSTWPMDLQPLYQVPVKEMPIKHLYDEAKRELYFTGEDGSRNGVWGPVDKAVFDYTVGGMNVIGSWFKYRKKEPGGKKTSPLDDIHVTEWPHEWSLEFTELLTVLTRLVSIEPQQEALLEEVLAGEVSTMSELADAGVAWPQTRDDRKPRRKPVEGEASQLF